MSRRLTAGGRESNKSRRQNVESEKRLNYIIISILLLSTIIYNKTALKKDCFLQFEYIQKRFQ